MTMISAQSPGRPRSFGLWGLLTLLSGARRAAASRAEHAPEAECRRDFVQAMLWENPDAFAGEQDVQNMMHCFPARY